MLNKSSSLVAMVAMATVIAFAGPASAKGKAQAAHKAHHHSGQQLLGNKIHANGTHVIDRVGKNAVSVVVKDGKITDFKVRNSDKGAVAVTKYKSAKRMALTKGPVMSVASYDPTLLAQSEDLGSTWIGYSFIDDYGDEQVYWFPYEEIYDGDTGATVYVPLG